MTDKQPILTCRGLMKRYGTVVAMNGADFDLYPGEITAVIGDNGAGKSTLVKVLAGVHAPSSGTISYRGKPVILTQPVGGSVELGSNSGVVRSAARSSQSSRTIKNSK